MGYVTAMSPCVGCGRVFSYNPMLVPSCSAVTGKREPICAECMAQANAKRKEMGLEPHPIAEDAYQAIPESEL